MAKIYTANEMRARANLESNTWGDRTTAAMLRQAADALEREEKRVGSELDGWRKQALEENAALDIAREQLAKSNALVKELANALECAISGFSREVVTYGEAVALIEKARRLTK